MRYDDDAGLVKAVLDGDKDAFVFLVDRYQGAVYAYCSEPGSERRGCERRNTGSVAKGIS